MPSGAAVVSQTSIAKQRRNLADGIPNGNFTAPPPCTGGTNGKVYAVGTKRGFCSIIFFPPPTRAERVFLSVLRFLCANVKLVLFVENITDCKINVTVDKVLGANYNKTELGEWSAGNFVCTSAQVLRFLQQSMVRL